MKKGEPEIMPVVGSKSRPWMDFAEARAFVRALALKSKDDWYRYLKLEPSNLPPLPQTLPRRPDAVYRGSGWVSWPDFLGNRIIPPRDRAYYSYEKAAEHVQKIGIKSNEKYLQYWHKEKPAMLPSKPERVYLGRGWQSWAAFLGTKNYKHIKWLPFAEARQLVRSLGLKSAKEYYAWCSGKLTDKGPKPMNIPIHPHVIYINDGWKGYGNYLGTSRISHMKLKYLTFQAARDYVRSLDFKTKQEFIEFWEFYKPVIIPKTPEGTYEKDGWRGWPDFLGIVKPRLHGWRAYSDAVKFVHSLGLRSHKEWIQYCRGKYIHLEKKPDDVPSNPYSVYAAAGWESWGQWLGTGNVKKRPTVFVQYAQAKQFAQGLGLRNAKQWKQYVKGLFDDKPHKPDGIPSTPDQVYRMHGWKGWADFLGAAD